MGSGIVALKYKDGVVLCSDTQCCYGGFAKYRNVKRIEKLNDNVMFASSGEFSDF